MQVSHVPAAVAFDDPNLVSCVGLVPAVELAQRCGLADLVRERVTLREKGGVNAHLRCPAWSPAVGVVGEEALKQVNNRLWGWVIDRLPFHSARKLLARSVRAEIELKDQLGPGLKKVWTTGRA
jgi:hypothetical protein